MKKTDDHVLRIYEVAYQIVPQIPEGGLEEEISALERIVTHAGGSILDKEMAVRQPLAYPIVHEYKGHSYVFQDAYFGWTKFESTPESATEIEKAFRTRDSVIRALVVKTIRERTFVPRVTEEEKVESPVVEEVNEE